jgi:iron uptake system component EfeO
LFACVWLVVTASACGKADDDAQRARVETEMKRWLLTHVRDFGRAAEDLRTSAPAPTDRGWGAQSEARAIADMKLAWHRGRGAYELVEGALAPLFPESDTATDFRYDDFLGVLGGAGDRNPFDDQGVIGMHAIERVLWSDAMPKDALEFEKGLTGYRPATFPANAEEAREFKEKLAGRLVSDVRKLEADLAPLELDIAFAFRGLIDLTTEQLEKVDRASTGREESRYALSTMRDLRANREGCLQAYGIFRPWLLAKGHGELDRQVQQGFERLKAGYQAVPGDSIPRPPEGWSGIEPKAEHAETPFGRLFFLVRRETDDGQPGSLAATLLGVADALGLPKAVLR